MKRKLTTRILLTTGLVSLVSSAMLIVIFLGVLPDRAILERQSRLTLAEMLAASSMSALARSDVDAITQLMAFAVDRHAALRSAAVREANGTVVTATDNHLTVWQDPPENRSTDTHIVVPLYSAGEIWGRAELTFKEITASGLAGFLFDDRLHAVLLLSALCFLGFYFYLGRMLRHLDPSHAVPARVRSALDTLTECLVLIDTRGLIVLSNQSFATLVGESAESLLGAPVNRFAWFDRDEQTIAAGDLPWTSTIKTGGATRNQPLSYVDTQGVRHSFLANCAPILGEAAKVNGVLISLDDVTELEAKEVELRAATDHAEAANRAKSEFLANMSHEIRTPMNAVLGFTELMRRGQVRDAAQAEQYLETVHRNGRHLLDLINDILDLSKVESGEFHVESIACAPHEIVHDVIDILSVRAREKGIDLRFEAVGQVPAQMDSDPARLRQVVTNLVGNAIKFTSTGEVVILEEYRESNPGRGEVRITVRDSGIGIPADKLAAIFEPFTQAESSTTRRFGGTGLGLTISRRFARALGGDITVQSEPGQGSNFTVVLPVVIAPDARHQWILINAAEAMQHTRQQVDIVASAWHFDHGKVLVVDDSAENRQLVSVVLGDAGLSITEAGDGREAIECMRRETFDVVLMDMQMPVMDGYEATRQLRRSGDQTTIIAFTAHALAGFDKAIEAVGCNGYLTKPIDIDAMLERLAGLIGATHRNLDQNYTTETAGRAAPAGLPLARPGQPLVSRLANQPRLQKIITRFRISLEARLSRMQTELDTRNFEELARSAHWLKGSAGSVGFDDFTEPAAQLEAHVRQGNFAGADECLRLIQALGQRVALGHNESQADDLAESDGPTFGALLQPSTDVTPTESES